MSSKLVGDGKGLPHVFELTNFEGLHETVQALRSKLERVDELSLSTVMERYFSMFCGITLTSPNSLFSALTIK